MNYMTKKAIMDRLQEHYEIVRRPINTDVFAIFLQGSQNYVDDLFFEGSDVDSRAIYLPNIKDIYLGKDISQVELVLDNEEHIDRFDIRKFLGLITTPGINNYECLFTEYAIVNPKYKAFYDELVSIREKLARVNEKKFLMSTMGISRRDLIDLQKRVGGEDYDIETFGYSRKRLSNIMRFNSTIKAYLDNKNFSACLMSMDQELIHKIRRTEFYTLEQAIEIAELTDKNTKELASGFEDTAIDTDTIEIAQDIIVRLMLEVSRRDVGQC